MPLSTGLIAFWADFRDEDIQALRQWHNCEHMSERVNIPGFRVGRRYRGFDRAATFLMYYETDTPEILASGPYQQALNNPTSWTKDTLKLFQNPARAIFALVDEAGITPHEPAFFLATMRFNLSGDTDSVVAEYREHVLRAFAQQDAVVRARLWEQKESISAIKTQESRIYGDGPGRQQFVLFVEAMKKVNLIMPDSIVGLSRKSRAAHTSVISEVGWLDFALR
jgi:hypothetical protein